MSRRNIGSDFDRFLEEEGLLEETTATAVKRVIAYQLAEKMAKDKLTKAEMARRMDTSRSSLDRLLDNSSVTLQTLQSAVQALGGRLKIEIDFHENAA
jgi:DNA-binding phage protein